MHGFQTSIQSVEQARKSRQWFLVDARGQVLGRLATQIATLLMGKHKPQYTPSIDAGDFVVVIHASKIRLTGKKLQSKKYIHHTGYLGHLKQESYESFLRRKPEEVLRKAVWGMLPKNRLGRQMWKRLKVYSGETHPHRAQKPAPFPLASPGEEIKRGGEK